MNLQSLLLVMETVTPTPIAKLGPSVNDVHIPGAMAAELSDEEEAKLKASLMELLITKSSALTCPHCGGSVTLGQAHG